MLTPLAERDPALSAHRAHTIYSTSKSAGRRIVMTSWLGHNHYYGRGVTFEEVLQYYYELRFSISNIMSQQQQ